MQDGILLYINAHRLHANLALLAHIPLVFLYPHSEGYYDGMHTS